MDPESTKNKTRADLDALKLEVAKLSGELVSTKNELARTNDLLYRVFLIDRFYFDKPIETTQDISTTGTLSVSTSLTMPTGSKVGLFGATPVVQQTAITTPTGGGGSSTDAIDISSRTAIGMIKTALANVGITA